MTVAFTPSIIIAPPNVGIEANIMLAAQNRQLFNEPVYKDESGLSQVPIPKLTTGSFHGLKTWVQGNIAKFTSSYPTVDDKGVSARGATPAQVQLARVGSKVAEDMDTKAYCYSGVKHALCTAGVIGDYGDMPKGSASNANKYFEAHPETFKELKNVKPEDIKKLTAGTIVVFSKPGKDGHIGIANGKGQLYSDCTDPSTWFELNGGSEEGASYRIFKLNDDVTLNRATGKVQHPVKK